MSHCWLLTFRFIYFKVNTTTNQTTSSPTSSGGRTNTPLASPINHSKLTTIHRNDATSTPIKSPVSGRTALITENIADEKLDHDCSLGVTAIFSNSAVDLKDVCLNDELLRVEREEIEDKIEDLDSSMSKSVPNIQSVAGTDVVVESGGVGNNHQSDITSVKNLPRDVTALAEALLKKRSDSEPLIVKQPLQKCDIDST